MLDSSSELVQKVQGLLSYELIRFGSISLNSKKIIIAVFTLWFFSKLSRSVERTLHRALMKKDYDPGAKTAVERFARYGVFMTGVIVTLTQVGVNLSTLETFGAVIGVGIGFGLQNITQNFISGLILLTERPIKRGDLIVIEGSTGRVLDIRVRSTLVLTRDDVVIIVPNSELITKQVVNQSFSGERIRYSINVGVAYGSDTHLVQETLLQIAQQHPHVLKSPPPSVQLTDFGASSLEFKLHLWLSELWFYEVILSEIRLEIDRRFAEQNLFLAGFATQNSPTKEKRK